MVRFCPFCMSRAISVTKEDGLLVIFCTACHCLFRGDNTQYRKTKKHYKKQLEEKLNAKRD